MLVAAALTTLFSVGAGFFLFASGDYAGKLMEQHYWAGIFTGFTIFVTAALFHRYWSSSRLYAGYLIALIISNIGIGLTSHLGGSITHGQDYLTEHLTLIMNSSDSYQPKPEEEMLLYEDIISPIFEAKCLSCHNSQKAKGNFLMTSYESITKPGDSNSPSITPASPEESEVYKRVVLPEDHDDHMPPEGKSALTPGEISLLKYWIESGAAPQVHLSEARKVDTVRVLIERLLPELSRYRRKAEIASLKRTALERELAEIANALSISITKDSLGDENHFSIAMKFPPAQLTNEQFRLLHPYTDVFSKASLVSSGIDDDGLYYLGQMTNLEKLFLQKTKLDGSGIIYLQNLQKLRILNLSFTQVDDKSAIDLLKIPNLEEVYLYQTNTSKQVVEALQKNRPGLKIYLQEGPYF